MTAPPLLEVRALSKRYGETVALDGADISFTAGTVHAVLGENGSGKSTLVKLLSGIVAPSNGSIVIDNVPVDSFLPLALQRRGVGTVFQEVLIAPDRSVADNILLGIDGLFRRHIPRAGRRQVAAELLARVARTPIDVAGPAGALKLAQRQLVVLARALAKRPRILILDEVTAALDYADRESVFAFMRQYTAAGGLIIFITHRIDEVTELSDRITVLRSGRVVRTLVRGEVDVATLLGLMAPARLDAADAA
ncbi:MAG: ATP-binding cassette domain-containing protein [Acetobacteraceae bacterium]